MEMGEFANGKRLGKGRTIDSARLQLTWREWEFPEQKGDLG